MTDTKYKYPRTPHTPWSRGTEDDKVLKSMDHFQGMEVVVTEKADGENTTMGKSYVHARSLDSANHPSRNWVKQLQGNIAHSIPEGWRICGENMYAKHSLEYDALPSYLLAFSIWNEKNECLSWDETVEWCELLGLSMVPVLYRGVYDEAKIRACWTQGQKSAFGAESEGYVIRNAAGFHYGDFGRNCAKMVRKGHVQTDTHWMHQEVVPNKLGNE